MEQYQALLDIISNQWVIAWIFIFTYIKIVNNWIPAYKEYRENEQKRQQANLDNERALYKESLEKLFDKMDTLIEKFTLSQVEHSEELRVIKDKIINVSNDITLLKERNLSSNAIWSLKWTIYNWTETNQDKNGLR